MAPDMTYTLDSCICVKIVQNPNFVNLLKLHINSKNSMVYVNEQVVKEIQRKFGYEIDHLLGHLKSSLGAGVFYGNITDKIETDAKYLLKHTSVHNGDAQILAFTRDTDSILISCDKDLITPAISVGVSTINPDQLHPGNLEFQINKGRDKITQTVEKISNQVKKPIKKITWELFTA